MTESRERTHPETTHPQTTPSRAPQAPAPQVAAGPTTTRMGKRGTLVIPAALRRRHGLDEGTLVLLEETAEGVRLRPAVAVPVEEARRLGL